VSQDVGDRALEELLSRRLQWLCRSEVIVETFQRGKEAIGFLFPRQWLGTFPALFALRDGKPPVQPVAKIGWNLYRHAARRACTKLGESRWSIADGLTPR